MSSHFSKIVLVLTGLLAVSACTYPTSSVNQGTDSGHIAFQGALPGTTLLLDGHSVGDATTYDGIKHVLDVPPGSHHVSAQYGERTVYDRDIYVGAGSNLTIKVQ